MERVRVVGRQGFKTRVVERPAVRIFGPEQGFVEAFGGQVGGFLALDLHVLQGAGFKLGQLGGREGGVGQHVLHQRQQRGQVPREAVERERGAVEARLALQRSPVECYFVGNLAGAAGGGAFEQHPRREQGQAGLRFGQLTGPEHGLQAHHRLGGVVQYVQPRPAGQRTDGGIGQCYAGQRLNGRGQGTVKCIQ